ncbi:cupin domain-containing protein [Candidatus Poribacteria bacterium]
MDVINRDDVEPFITKDSSEIREILAPRNSIIQRQSLAEARLLPGRSTEEHYHIRTEEIYYILTGSGHMVVDGEKRDVKRHDGIAIAPGAKHKITNTGDDDLIFLCCCVPAYEHDDTLVTE